MKIIDRLFSNTNTALLSAIGAALIFAGCASPFGKENRAYIYVAENETISCLGKTFKMFDEVASFLVEKGGTPETVVIIVAQGDIPNYYLRSLVSACGHKGFTQVYIRGNLRANATISEPERTQTGKMQNATSGTRREPAVPVINSKRK